MFEIANYVYMQSEINIQLGKTNRQRTILSRIVAEHKYLKTKLLKNGMNCATSFWKTYPQIRVNNYSN